MPRKGRSLNPKQRRAAAAFETWMLSQRGLAKATVYYQGNRLRRLTELGIDLESFTSSPAAARRQGDRVIATLKRQGTAPHSVRTLQKTLNLLVEWGRAKHPKLPWAKWKCEREPASPGRALLPGDLDVLLQYEHADQAVQAVRRALVWVGWHTSLRRSELARLSMQDLNPATSEVRVAAAAKGGIERWFLVSRRLWHPSAPLAQYLRIRPSSSSDALFLNRSGVRYTPGGISRHLEPLSEHLGHRFSFVRTRRSSLTELDERGVNIRTLQHRAGHRSVASTLKYLGAVSRNRQLEDYRRAKVPGFMALKRNDPNPGSPSNPITAKRRAVHVARRKSRKRAQKRNSGR